MGRSKGAWRAWKACGAIGFCFLAPTLGSQTGGGGEKARGILTKFTLSLSPAGVCQVSANHNERFQTGSHVLRKWNPLSSGSKMAAACAKDFLVCLRWVTEVCEGC